MGLWINVKDQLPEDGQQVYYFSPILGLWRGKYVYTPFTYTFDADGNKIPVTAELAAAISPHVFVGGGGSCDTDEVTHWQPYDEDHATYGWIPLPPMFDAATAEARFAEYRAWRHKDALAKEFRELEKSPPNVLPDISWMDADELLVDPPSGWRYGFPKTWNKATHPDMVEWLIENGYPERAARDAGLVCRFMTVAEVANG